MTTSAYAPDVYNGDGSTTVFAITFGFLSVSTNVKVSTKVTATGVVTVKTAGTHYNISGSNVTFTAGNVPPSTVKVILELNPDFLQGSDYIESGILPAETLEADLDERNLEAQILKQKLDRALLAPVGTSLSSDGTIPLMTAGEVLRVNSSANGFESTDPVNAALTSAVTPTDGVILVGDGTDFVGESGATARTSLGVGTGDSPQLTGIELGHATDTTITRASAGDLNIEGNIVYRAGGTDVPVADGGTGASSLTDGGVLLGSGTGAITAMAVLADGEMIVGDGTTDPVAESGATLRTSIGVGTGDSPQLTGIELGHATDTTISRVSAGKIAVEGVNVVTTSSTDTLSNKTLVAPALGTPASGVATNLTGTASGLTAGNVTTNANLTGDVTSVGNVTTIAAGAVDVAMLAAGTDGELITWDAAGNPAVVAVGTANHVLTSNGAGVAPTFQAVPGGLADIVDDTTPQLGGSLDVNGNKIVSVSNGNIDIEPNGTGNVLLGNFTLDADQSVGAGQDNYVLTYDNGSGLISLEASSGAGLSNVVDDTTPQLGGMLDVNGQAIGDGTLELLTFTEDASAVNHVNIENQATGGGPIISAAGDDTNIDLNLVGKGTGNVKVGTLVFDGDQTVGAGQDNYVLTYDNGAGTIALEAASGGVTAASQAEQETSTEAAKYVAPLTQQFHPSAAKVWVYFEVGSGVPSVTGSYNLTSVDDDGVGLFGITFATDFSAATYCAVTMANEYSASTGSYGALFRAAGSYATTDCDISTNRYDGARNDTAAVRVGLAFFGDQ